MVGASTVPFALAMVVAGGCFAALLPWLIHESRRAVDVRPVVHLPAALFDVGGHPRMCALAVCTRSFAVTVARAMEPTPAAAVTRWHASFAEGLACACEHRSLVAGDVAVIPQLAPLEHEPVLDLPAEPMRPRRTRPATVPSPERTRRHRHPRDKQLTDALTRAGEVGHAAPPSRRERTVARAR